MDVLADSRLIWTYATRRLPRAAMASIRPFDTAPRVGDLMLGEVLEVGNHMRVEDGAGALRHIFPGSKLIGSFANRYATDQFEAYVPRDAVAECDLVSVGGVCGEIVSRHTAMNAPTRLRILGSVCDAAGRTLSTRDYRVGRGRWDVDCPVILVVGASMNAGKTTLVGTLTRALSHAGLHVAAAKLTGTAAGKDTRFFESCGAAPVLDFIDAGVPATYMLELDELKQIHATLLASLCTAEPDVIVLEVADGIFQRETRMLLEDHEFCSGINHLLFAASDSLAADCGAGWLRERGLPLRAIGGCITQSPLMMREAEQATGLPCLGIQDMLDGAALRLLRDTSDPPRRKPRALERVA